MSLIEPTSILSPVLLNCAYAGQFRFWYAQSLGNPWTSYGGAPFGVFFLDPQESKPHDTGIRTHMSATLLPLIGWIKGSPPPIPIAPPPVANAIEGPASLLCDFLHRMTFQFQIDEMVTFRYRSLSLTHWLPPSHILCRMGGKETGSDHLGLASGGM
jgi:hypothetical protein